MRQSDINVFQRTYRPVSRELTQKGYQGKKSADVLLLVNYWRQKEKAQYFFSKRLQISYLA